jgi:hypothetical protein
MSVQVDTNCCSISKDDESFWDSHQTMSDGNVWCPVKSRTDQIVNRAKAEVKAKYGNKKKHKQ